CGVVQSRQELCYRGLSGTVLPDERDPLADIHMKVHVSDRPPFAAGVAEAHVLEPEPLLYGLGDRPWILGVRDSGAYLEEGEQIAQVERLFECVSCTREDPLHEVPASGKACGEEGERSDCNRSVHRLYE